LEIFRRLSKDKVTTNKLFWTFTILFCLIIGYRLPLPGINTEYLSSLADFMNKTSVSGVLGTLMGNTFQQMSIFALSITPYISASIIIELLGIVFPALGKLSKDGSVGREKLNKIILLTAGIIAVIESLGLALSLGKQGLFVQYNAWMVIFATVMWTAGACFLVWVGQFITKKLIGDGPSLILLFNILSTLPNSFISIYTATTHDSAWWLSIIIALIIAIITILVFAYVVILSNAEKRIHITNSGRGTVFMEGASKNVLPLKLNMGGVMPIIFASSFMSAPSLIVTLFKLDSEHWLTKVSMFFNQANWFNIDNLIYTLGLLLFIPLTFAFSYFYIKMTFSPQDIADNLRKSGSILNGLRPGQPTADYLKKQMVSLFWIGTAMLLVISLVPTFISGMFRIDGISFGGTSAIIIVGVIVSLKEKILAQTSKVTYKTLTKKGKGKK
jgi:preprotein translocase subunit SecY